MSGGQWPRSPNLSSNATFWEMMMAQQVPSPSTLKESVETASEQNESIGYNSTGFTQMTEGGYADNLVAVGERLIQRGETYEAVSEQLDKNPDILTLEDLVFRSLHGRLWGLAESTLELEKARVEAWETEIGHQRWSPP